MSATTALAAFVFLTSLLLAAAWLWGPPLRAGWQRARVRRQPFPAAWREVLRRRMPAFARLPTSVQLQLKKHAQVLIAEKPFVGCAGLQVTEEMRVLVAVQAALLLLNRRAGYFPGLRQVLIYPGAFVVERVTGDPLGLAHETRRVLAGESWQQGQVILSWSDVLAGAADPDDGQNVVIHEFAHQLDQENGPANGAPWLGGRLRRQRWADVMGRAFASTRQRLDRAEPSVVDAYGISDAAEFFAVLSERFFERPEALAAELPAAFAELTRFYCVDPLHWRDGDALSPGPAGPRGVASVESR